jgi:threonine dehydrogenase-like Zn-dependent dehydrogenase
MIRSVKKSGKAVCVGVYVEPLPISPLKDFLEKEIQLLSIADHVKSEIPEVIKYIEQGRFDMSRSVSHKFSLKDINEAVRVLNDHIGNPARVVLETE